MLHRPSLTYVGHLLKQNDGASLQFIRQYNNAELGSRYKLTPKVGWFRRRGTRMLYPTSNPIYMRRVGVDLNLQERLDKMMASEKLRETEKRIYIGFPRISVETPMNNRKKLIAWRKEQKSNRSLEIMARNNTLTVEPSDVTLEHERCGAYFEEVFNAANIYGIYDDLFDGAYFRPVKKLSIFYDYDEDTVTPVHRGNIIKPKEATTAPEVNFDSDPDDLWTLTMSNPDGHFLEENVEYLHWMVANIKGGDLSTGNTVCAYMQPFPPMGTGYHRHVFVLYKQKGPISLEKYAAEGPIDLAKRTFRSARFHEEKKADVTPAGLAFFQSDWDSSLTTFYHETLNMREPRYEYEFSPHYMTPWNKPTPTELTAFNLFLDPLRDPKDVQEEVLKKKLKLTQPFKGQLDGHIKYPNAHGPQRYNWRDEEVHGTWRLREIERERLRQGVYRDMDWTKLRRDPTVA